MTEEFMFYVKWEDGEKKEHIVGILACIEGKYYLKGKNIEEINKKLSTSIFDGIPPYRDDKLHTSDSLFKFFEMKIPKEKSEYESLKESLGKSHIESYTVEEIKKEDIKEWKELILALAKKQTENTEKLI